MANLEGSQKIIADLLERWAEVEASAIQPDPEADESEDVAVYHIDSWNTFVNTLTPADFVALANVMPDIIRGWKRDAAWLEQLKSDMKKRTDERLKAAGFNLFDHLKKDR